MKLLLQHVDYIRFKATKKTKLAVEIPEEEKQGEMKECLFVRFATEKDDEKNERAVVKNAVKNIKEVAETVKTKKIMLYPYVHLLSGSEPSGIATAIHIYDGMTEGLKKEGFEVKRAPFGYYKEFEMKCKGHPLSELSRVIHAEEEPEEIVSDALEQEHKVKSEWFILETSGNLVPAEKYDFKGHKNLEKFYKYEFSKVRAVSQEPPHTKLMRSLELVDYEPGTDPGNFRFYPKGRLVKSLLEELVTKKAIEYGAMEVETPVMYDFDHPALKSYLERFPARQYILESAKKKFFLRFSACFGQFLMSSDATISYKDLPMKIYELTRYSFRLEQAGELVGLRRLRAFTMPDMHTFCKDMNMAMDEFKKQFMFGIECMGDIGFDKNDYEAAIRFTKDFWKEKKNQEFIKSIAKEFGKPILVELWNKRFAYFDPKYEFNFVDALDKASALATVQIDHENAERYGITFTNEKDEQVYPKILHCSPSGSIERVMYALLEKAYLDSKKGKNPMLPLWLSPTQVRICPVADRHLKHCEKIAKEIEKENIRVDIDDRTETVGKKISQSEKEWIPYVIVIGDKEEKSEKLPVRVRETGKVTEMSIQELVKEIKEKTKEKPFKKLSLPKYLSKRPIFSR